MNMAPSRRCQYCGKTQKSKQKRGQHERMCKRHSERQNGTEEGGGLPGTVCAREPATQRALNILEILTEIFHHIPHPLFGFDIGDLAACALVCRKWQEPACAVLWGNIVSGPEVANLLSLIEFREYSDYTTKPAQIVDISRLLHYSKWIKGLDFNECELSKEVQLFRDVWTLNKGRTICPALDSISLSIHSDGGEDYPLTVMGIYGENLKRFQLDIVDNMEPPIHYLIDDFPTSCPKLEDLNITGVNTQITKPTLQRRSLHRSLRLLSSLTTIRLDAEMIDLDLLLLLGEMPSLVSLAIKSRDSSSERSLDIRDSDLKTWWQNRSGPFEYFCKLSKLSISLDVAICEAILQSVFTHSPIRSLDLDQFSQAWSLSRVPVFSKEMTILSENLTSIQLTVDHRGYKKNMTKWPVLTLEQLSHLKTCTALKRFVFLYAGKLEVDNNELLGLTRCWPDLTDLKVSSRVFPGKMITAKSLSFAIINGLAYANPKLTTLHLTISKFNEFSLPLRKSLRALRFLYIDHTFLDRLKASQLTSLAVYIGYSVSLLCTVTCQGWLSHHAPGYNAEEYAKLEDLRRKAAEELGAKVEAVQAAQRSQKALCEGIPLKIL